MTNKTIVMMGDTHRLSIMENLISEANLTDSIVIHVGDIGVFDSFHKNFDKVLNNIENSLAARNVTFYGIRGNHDDPKYFTKEYFDRFNHLKLVPDYTRLNIQGEDFLFVGGAISVNRMDLVPNVSWWEDEVFVHRPELVSKCDVLVSHTAHPFVGPAGRERIEGYLEKDVTLWQELYAEREEFHDLFKIAKPRKHYCGHFHVSEYVKYMDCDCRILDVKEMREHRPPYK